MHERRKTARAKICRTRSAGKTPIRHDFFGAATAIYAELLDRSPHRIKAFDSLPRTEAAAAVGIGPVQAKAKGPTMSRKFKVIGLALVAICAMSAISAAGAQAKTFHSEVETTYYTGTQTVTNVFTTTAGTVKCKGASFKGEATATGGSGTNWTRETVEVTPTYTECTAFGQAATVTTNGCEYNLNANGTVVSVTGCSNTGVGGVAYSGVVVHVTSGNCTVTVPNQHFTGAAVSYTNEGAGTTRDVAVAAAVSTQITYSVDGPGTICGTPNVPPADYSDGSYAGTVTTKGYSNAAHTAQVGVWVE
jgi:hypothetical protein